MGRGLWTEGYGQRAMGRGLWTEGYGRRAMEDRQGLRDYGLLITVYRLLIIDKNSLILDIGPWEG